MNKRGSFSDCPEHSHDEQKERIKRALLTPADTWLEPIVPQILDTKWFEVINIEVPEAIKTIKRGGAAHSDESLKIKAAREKFFSYFGMTDAAHDLYGPLHKILIMHHGTYPSPEAFIHNARILSAANVNVVATIKANPDLLRRHINIESTEEVWQKLELEGNLMTTLAALAAYNPDTLEAKLDTALRLARPLQLRDKFEVILAERPTLLEENAMRQVVMARVALEFYNTQHFMPQDIALFSLESVESILIAGLEKRFASIADAKAVSRHTYSATARERRGRHRPTQERRQRLMEFLNDPANLNVFGGAALNSYFLYRPVTEAERAKYFVASALDKKGKADATPLRRRHRQWLGELVGESTELNNEWFMRANIYARIGSKNSTKNKTTIREAKRRFFEQVGIPDLPAKSQYQRLSDGTRIEYLPKPSNFIKIVDIFQSKRISEIDKITTDAFRIFYDNPKTVNDKLDQLTAFGYELDNPEVRAVLTRLLGQSTSSIGRLPSSILELLITCFWQKYQRLSKKYLLL